MARHMTIINANVLDVKNGTHELSTVKIEDGIISDIETQDGFTVEEGKDIFDIQGKFLSPGFIDTHSLSLIHI